MMTMTTMANGCRLCNGDANGDGFTNGSDVSIVLANYGKRVKRFTRGDVNGDKKVTRGDLEIVMNNYGCICG